MRAEQAFGAQIAFWDFAFGGDGTVGHMDLREPPDALRQGRAGVAASPARLLSLWGRIDLVGYAQTRQGRCHVCDVWVILA
ncbi:hypothetical protein GCM10027514_14920 [Azotobacter armeniacus]